MYKNGNYIVRLSQKGTKICSALRRGEEFIPEFPDSIDIKLTDMCSIGCPYCHESSTRYGKHGNLVTLKEILKNLPEVSIELCFGGGNIFEMELVPLSYFFRWCKERNHRISITVNYDTFLSIMNSEALIYRDIIDQIDSIGVSISPSHINSRTIEEFNIDLYNWVSKIDKQIVYHLILGTFSEDWLSKFICDTKNKSVLGNNDLGIYLAKKVLILGYKSKGRGKTWNSSPSSDKFENIRKFLVGPAIDYMENVILSFDNLAISQLRMRSMFTTEEWEEFYLGDDFTHSMYIDLPGECYGPSSTSEERVSFEDEKYGLNIVEYFKNERKR